MSYQDIYGTCWDNEVGNGHTSSQRGKVTFVGLECNTRYGTCVNVGVHHTNGENIVTKPDLRKVKKEDRKAVSDKYLKEVSDFTKEIININVYENSHFMYNIAGYNVGNVVEFKKKLAALSDPRVIQYIKDLELIDQI